MFCRYLLYETLQIYYCSRTSNSGHFYRQGQVAVIGRWPHLEVRLYYYYYHYDYNNGATNSHYGYQFNLMTGQGVVYNRKKQIFEIYTLVM